MGSPKHQASRVEKVLVKMESSSGGKIELVRLNSKIVVCQQVRTEKVYGIRYKGVMVFMPDSFEKASKYLWNEFLDP